MHGNPRESRGLFPAYRSSGCTPGHRLVRQRSGSAALQLEVLFKKESGVCTDHVFWKRSILNQEKPPVIDFGASAE
jgi:hypothetical protein